MRNLYTRTENQIVAGLHTDGRPFIQFAGASFFSASDGANQVVFSGRIDRIQGKEWDQDSSSAARKILNILLEKTSFENINGQYIAVAIIRGQLTAHRSSFCGESLFYGDTFISNNIISLCKVENKISFSKEYLFKFILDLPAWQYDGQLSPIDGIYRLPSNSNATLTPAGIQIEQLPFKPLQHQYFRTQTHQDAGRIILNNLRQTIKKDLLACGDRSIVCELSGGLDSSFVTALVAEQTTNIKSHVYSFPDQPSHQQSINYAKSVAKKYAIPLEVVNGNEIPTPDLKDSLPVGSEPADFFWQGALFGPVINKICGPSSAVFTGFGADQILNRTNSVLVSLLKHAHLRSFIRIAKDLADSTDRSTINYIWQAIIAATPKKFLLRLLSVSHGLNYNLFATEEIADQLRFFEPNHWLKTGLNYKSLLELEKLWTESARTQGRFFRNCLAHPNLYYLAAPSIVWGPYLQAGDVWQLHPFCDSQLIETTFHEISWHLIHDWKNLYKQSLREAQRDILPEELRLRKKDDFSFDGFFLRVLRKNQDTLFDLALSHSDLLDGRFNRPAFETIFEQNQFGVQTIQTQKLNRYLAYAVWAHNFRKYFDSSRPSHASPKLA